MLHLESPKGLSPTGVGPLLFGGQLIVVGLALLAVPDLHPPPTAVRLVGVAWLAAGVVLWATALRIFLKEFPHGTLIVEGPYRFSRNPMYSSDASLIVFVVPALALITGAWTLLVAAAGGAALAYPLVLSEERDLERTFGDEWRQYRARTSWLVPWLPKQ
ncbi:MAG: isoprenylcysteine carboxylmethyltransferase family protein [Deltaproteobacteria bacterium]|nr:isoprenylcysteine carboxylmethyltransferase family protein [Deltaproteobacteria bacterium]